MDETYVKVKGAWMYLYRAVDSAENTLEFLLSATQAAAQTEGPRAITVDKNAASPKALNEVKAEGTLPASSELCQVKDLSNRVE